MTDNDETVKESFDTPEELAALIAGAIRRAAAQLRETEGASHAGA